MRPCECLPYTTVFYIVGIVSVVTKGRLVMITLKDAVEVAQTDLQVLSNQEFSLARPLVILSEVVSSLPKGGDAPIMLAREACEAIVDCAHVAEDAGNTDVAERLRDVVCKLSLVAALIPWSYGH